MKKLFAAFCLITILTFTPALYAQTATPVLSPVQQEFIRTLCLNLLSSPDTPGELLAPGLTPDRFCEARVVDAFFLANWTDLLAKHNGQVVIVTDHEARIVVLEAATPVDVTALQASVTSLSARVVILEAALESIKTALGTP